MFFAIVYMTDALCDNRNILSSGNAIMAKDFGLPTRNNARLMPYEWIQKIIGNERGAKAKLARAIDMEQDKLSKVFSGEREFTPKELLRVAKFLEISVEEVITGEKPAQKKTQMSSALRISPDQKIEITLKVV